MSDNQATIEDLIDELYDVLDKGWKLPFSPGKVMVDVEEVRALLDEIREEIPAEVRKARSIMADHSQIIEDAHREADTIVRMAKEKADAMVDETEIMRAAQAKANEVLGQTQAQVKEMRRACNEYVEDLLHRTDDAISENLAELRKTRQGIKSSSRTSQI